MSDTGQHSQLLQASEDALEVMEVSHSLTPITSRASCDAKKKTLQCCRVSLIIVRLQ